MSSRRIHLAGLLDLDDLADEATGTTVREALKSKQPDSVPLCPDALIQENPPPPPHPVMFEALTREVIRRAALKTHRVPQARLESTQKRGGGCAPCSQLLPMVSVYDALALCPRRLATKFVDPQSLRDRGQESIQGPLMLT